MGLRGFERRLERVVEGAFARAFRSDVKPVEIGRRLVREMDDHRTVDVRGRTVVPNYFHVLVSPDDHGHLAGIATTLCTELANAAHDHATSEGYIFVGPVTVDLAASDTHKVGAFTVTATMKEIDRKALQARTHSFLVLPSNERVLLGSTTVVIGRHPDCDITIEDPNLSRRHAEIRHSDTGYVFADLGATNASRINGLVTKNHPLRRGDEILIGVTTLRFETTIDE